MDLEIFPIRTTGRNAIPIDCVADRDLTLEDLQSLAEGRGTGAKPIKEIRERHHTLARMLVGGFSDAACSAATGYNLPWISKLKHDPTFMELLAAYQEEAVDTWHGTQELLSGLSRESMKQLWDLLEDEPESFTKNQLMEMAKMGADRTGHGPQSQSTQVNVNLDMAGRMERARQRQITEKEDGS